MYKTTVLYTSERPHYTSKTANIRKSDITQREIAYAAMYC